MDEYNLLIEIGYSPADAAVLVAEDVRRFSSFVSEADVIDARADWYVYAGLKYQSLLDTDI